MNYLYNGFELPSLPGRDTETYPFAVIIRSALSNVINLYFTAKESTMDYNATYLYAPYIRYRLTDEVWEYGAEYSEDKSVSNSASTVMPIWSNHDIYYTDGNLYLAASTPIPCTTLDPTSLLQGYLVGRRLASLRGKVTDSGTEEPSGTIVGYSYNGVVLPNIDEVWTDKETYPYATINQVEYDIALYLWSGVLAKGGTDAVNMRVYGLTDGAYSFIYESPSYPYAFEADFWDGLVWSNHDILNEDGTLYLAASDPVPVYE